MSSQLEHASSIFPFRPLYRNIAANLPAKELNTKFNVSIRPFFVKNELSFTDFLQYVSFLASSNTRFGKKYKVKPAMIKGQKYLMTSLICELPMSISASRAFMTKKHMKDRDNVNIGILISFQRLSSTTICDRSLHTMSEGGYALSTCQSAIPSF